MSDITPFYNTFRSAYFDLRSPFLLYYLSGSSELRILGTGTGDTFDIFKTIGYSGERIYSFL